MSAEQIELDSEHQDLLAKLIAKLPLWDVIGDDAKHEAHSLDGGGS